MPTVGELHTAKGSEEHPEEGYRSRYSHDSEVTEAGYYAVTLDDYRVRTELTVTPRTGIPSVLLSRNMHSPGFRSIWPVVSVGLLPNNV